LLDVGSQGGPAPERVRDGRDSRAGPAGTV